jgi:SAM-dependent methyltransferase
VTTEAPPRNALPTVDAACFLCENTDTAPVWTTPDRTFGVPGIFHVVRCRRCGFLYMRPRPQDDHLADCYPDEYPRHQEPPIRTPFRGSPRRLEAVRYALSRYFGYDAYRDLRVSLLTRLRGRRLVRRLRWDCPPWVGQGRYLDVGCGSGWALSVAKALGWRVAGIEVDAPAAEKARRFTDDIHVGSVFTAPFAADRFDLITTFHVLEHVPDPLAMLRRMLEWLAPDGLLVIEVPNVGSLGARLFGADWYALDLPRHLSHFTPESLAGAVQRAGGRVVWCWHRSKPRDFIRSWRHWLRDRGWHRVAAATEQRPVYGVLKLGLELVLPFVRGAGYGEVIRIGVVHARPRP